MRLLSNRAVFSWNFFLQRIFRISVFSRRSKARQTTPTHLRSLSPRRYRNSNKTKKPFRQNQSTEDYPNMIKLNTSRDIFYCETKQENRVIKTKSRSLFSMRLSLFLEIFGGRSRPAADQQIEVTLLFFGCGCYARRGR